jgi:hypothetical protein
MSSFFHTGTIKAQSENIHARERNVRLVLPRLGLAWLADQAKPKISQPSRAIFFFGKDADHC